MPCRCDDDALLFTDNNRRGFLLAENDEGGDADDLSARTEPRPAADEAEIEDLKWRNGLGRDIIAPSGDRLGGASGVSDFNEINQFAITPGPDHFLLQLRTPLDGFILAK